MPAEPNAGVPPSVAVAGLLLPATWTNDMPAGRVPLMDNVGLGVPVAVTGSDAVAPSASVSELALVMIGATGALVGVTATGADARPGPTALVAITEQSYGVPLVMPLTVMGEVLPLPVRAPGLRR